MTNKTKAKTSPKHDFIKTLDKYRHLLWPFIEKNLNQIKTFPEYCQLDKKYQSLIDFHFDMVADYPRRQGKYLRPTLTFLTAQSMGIRYQKVVPTAATMQISEDWILGHDDIEDQSKKRRGKAALQKIYGDELAINAGDSLHVLMWQVLDQNLSKLDHRLASKIHQEFFTMINRTLLGQTIEIKWAKENRFDLSIEDVLLILESKTGYYTIAGPMRLGAIIAGASQYQLKQIYKFGVILGRSFQIIDDLLDLTSDFAGLKKQQGNDIYEGKRTIMLVHLLNNISPRNKKKLHQILSKSRRQKSKEDIKWIIDQMNKVGSIDYGQKLAHKFAKQAVEIFDNDLKFIKEQPYRNQIRSAIDFIINRSF